MMWLCDSSGDQRNGAFAYELHVEQTIPVQMREFPPFQCEADSAEAVDARLHTFQPEGGELQRLHRTEPLPMPESSPRQ